MSLLPVLEYSVIPTYDVRVLTIADVSDWKHIADEASYIDITTVGRKKPVTLHFRKNKINLYNSNNLDLSHVDSENALIPLPDGIYKAKIYVCEGEKFSYEKCFLRTVKIQLELDQELIKMKLGSCELDKKKIDKLNMVQLLLKSGHANIKYGNVSQASLNYEKAKELLEDLKDCNDRNKATTYPY